MLLSFARKIALCCGLVAGITGVVFGQTNYYMTNGTEYAIVGSLPGDQVFPDVAVNTNGGFIVWQDNVTDGSGWGVSAARLDSTLTVSLSTFRVNVQGANDQENARVALLKNGGAVFVWQGGQPSQQHIFARFLSSSYTFLTTNDVPVNTFTNNFQINPAVATLTNGNVVIVWGSFDEVNSGSMLDVYGRIFSPVGVPLTGEFLVNEFTNFNQRTPAVAALANGGFVVAWVSETNVAAPNATLQTPGQMQYASVDIYARLYNGGGVANGNEFPVNAGSNPCANPAVAAASDGSFMIAWDARDMTAFTNGLDVYARPFSSAAVGGTILRVNSYLYGDQYAPRISSLGTDYLIVWTSLAQDGSREGVYGQFFSDGSEVGGEFRVNPTTFSCSIQPVVTSDGVGQFLAIWSSFIGLPYGFDLFAQRYINVNGTCDPMAAPFVYAPFTLSSNGAYQPQLVVSWPALLGISVSNYEVYVDGATTPKAVVTTNVWTMTAANGLTTSSTHYFQVAYTTTAGCQSPLSAATTNSTWGGQSWGGIPFEWMTEYFGALVVSFNNGVPSYNWPSPNTPLVPGGPTLLQVFLTGGNPTNSATWLQTSLTKTSQGLFLTWNTQPGFTYQVQVQTNFAAGTNAWSNFSAPRFAAGISDSIYVGGAPSGYYQVMLLRQ